MAIYVNTNVESMISQNALAKNTSALSNVMKQLSTGLKVNSAKDDAAGLAISETMKAQIRGNKQAISNIQNGMNMINTAEGGMASVTENIVRIRELAVQAANEIYDDEKKQAIMNEIKQLITNIDVTARTTTFAGKNLTDGTFTSLVLQTGANSDAEINTINIGDSMTNLHTSAGALDIFLEITDLGSATGNAVNGANWDGDAIREYIAKLDLAINKISLDRSMIGAYTNRLESVQNNLTTMNENLTQANSTITDVDTAEASSTMVKYQILQQTSTIALQQANSMPQIALTLLSA